VQRATNLTDVEISGSCGVPPQSRRDADGGPTARSPQSGQLRSQVDFWQIRREYRPRDRGLGLESNLSRL